MRICVKIRKKYLQLVLSLSLALSNNPLPLLSLWVIDVTSSFACHLSSNDGKARRFVFRIFNWSGGYICFSISNVVLGQTTIETDLIQADTHLLVMLITVSSILLVLRSAA